jgi:hypothetical protein
MREGRGEEGSIENLIARALVDLGLHPRVFDSLPKSPRFTITTPERAVQAARIAAKLRPDAVLLTADLEDGCPSTDAPLFAAEVRKAAIGFPIAIVFFYREYETLAISIAPRLVGRQLLSPTGKAILTVQAPANLPMNPEQPRDAKGWIGRELFGGLPYKPTIHQLPLTRLMGINELRSADLSSYRRLESGLTFLAEEVRSGGRAVYPQP